MKHISELMSAESFEKLFKRNAITSRIDYEGDIKQKWEIIRQVYELINPEIMDAAENDLFSWYDPYFLDWSKLFSPIEYDAWCEIRESGIVMYPQYPVLNYFIDFANPYLKIGIELDGKNFHDPEKDNQRDKKLKELNWNIYRIKGCECYTKHMDICDIYELDEYGPQYEKELINYYTNTCVGVIRAIKYFYFIDEGVLDEIERRLCIRTLLARKIDHYELPKRIMIIPDAC